MRKYNRLAVALLDLRTDPPLSLIIVFLCGVMILATSGNYIYSWVPLEVSLIYTFRCFGIIFIFLIIAFVAYRHYEQTLAERTTAIENSQVAPVKYIITGLSPYSKPDGKPDNLENVRRIISHNKSRLETLYLVSLLEERVGADPIVHNTAYTQKSSERVIVAYQKLKTWIDEHHKSLNIQLVPLIDTNSAEYSFHKVSELLISLRAEGIPVSDVLVDVTAGTKAMSVGLATAAFVNGFQVSYQATKRDAEGNPSVSSDETTLVALNLANHLRLPD